MTEQRYKAVLAVVEEHLDRNGVDHLLTEPRSPTTTGKIERFHRTLRVEFDTRQVKVDTGAT